MTRTHICPLSLHDALPIFNSSLRHGSFAAFWLHNNKGRLTRGCNPTSSKFIHTWLRFGEIMRGSLSAKRLCAVTRQVDIVCSEGVVTSYLDGTFCDRHPIQVDAAIGRIQGIGAVPFTQIEPNPRLAVTRQVDVAV